VSTGSRTARAAAGMGAVTAVSRGLGFVRVLVVTAVLGTTSLGDAFQSANSVSNVLFELLAAGALSAVLVPTFVRLVDGDDQPGAERVAGGVLGVALAVLGPIVVIGVVFAPLLARALTIGVASDVAAAQQDLVTFLLRFFVPQVLLYAAGTIITAVLYAKRRFAITAAAPIGNTVVMVVCLALFRVVAGPDPGLDLTTTEKLLLVAAGTGGVLAFVGVLLGAGAASGFRLRPRWPGRDPEVGAVLRHSGWGVVLHTGAGLLLGAAIVTAAGVVGGVVAYQVGWVIFLAPYAILAQPIHTAILPEMVTEARDAGGRQVAASLRWALERMALLVLPATAAMIALASPALRVVEFGQTDAQLLAAAVAGLAVGLYAYSAFLLLARGYYALGDSRTPGVVSLASAGVGVVVMVVSAALVDGTARIVLLGLGHSIAYIVGAAVLALGLTRRTASPLRPAALGRIALVSAFAGVGGWAASQAVLGDDPGRLAALATVMVIAATGAGVVVAGYRLLGVPAALSKRAATDVPVASGPLEESPALPPEVLT
jgi:putative peptidoglycan lipid II flippase